MSLYVLILIQLTRFKVQAVKTPLEQLVVDSCSQKLTSVLSDLSGLSLRQQPLPLPAGDHGGGGGRFGPPGVTKDGEFFLTELLKFAKEVMSQSDVEGLEHREPFDDEVCRTMGLCEQCNCSLISVSLSLSSQCRVGLLLAKLWSHCLRRRSHLVKRKLFFSFTRTLVSSFSLPARGRGQRAA